MITVNLLPRQRAVLLARARRLRHWWLAGGAYALLFLGSWVALGASQDSPAPLQREFDSLQARIKSARLQLAEQRAAISTTRRALDAAHAVGDHPDFSRLLTLLARTRGGSVTLERIDLAPAPGVSKSSDSITRAYVLTIDGVADSQRSVSAYVSMLESLGLFDSVKLAEVRSRAVDASKGTSFAGFQVVCTASDSAPGGPR